MADDEFTPFVVRPATQPAAAKPAAPVQPPAANYQPGQVFTDPETGEPHPIVDPLTLNKQPGQWTPADVENRLAVLSKPQPALPAAPVRPASGPKAESLTQWKPEEAAGETYDPKYVNLVLSQTPPAQRAAAAQALGTQRAELAPGPVAAGATGALQGVSLGFADPLAALGFSLSGGPDYKTSLEIANAATRAHYGQYPETFEKAQTFGTGLVGAAFPESLYSSPARTAATNAIISGGQSLAQNPSDPAAAGWNALTNAVLGGVTHGALTGPVTKVSYEGEPGVHEGAPGAAQLHDLANADYEAIKAPGNVFQPSFGARTLDALDQTYSQAKVGDLTSNTKSILEGLRQDAKAGPLTAARLNEARVELNNLAYASPTAAKMEDRLAASKLRNTLNDAVSGAQQGDMLSGDAADIGTRWSRANANSMQAHKIDLVEGAERETDLTGRPLGTELKSFLQKKSGGRYIENPYHFTPDELAQIEQAQSGGGALQQGLRIYGKTAPENPYSLTADIAGGLYGLVHDPKLAGGALFHGVTSYGARKWAESMTKGELQVAKEIMGARSPQGQATLNAPYLPPGFQMIASPVPRLPAPPVAGVYNPPGPNQGGQ
jgi:hypothetical protein